MLRIYIDQNRDACLGRDDVLDVVVVVGSGAGARPSESGGGESTNEPSQQRTDRISLRIVPSRCQFIGVMHLENFLPFSLSFPFHSLYV